MSDRIAVGVLLLSFALLTTVHFSIVVGLARKAPKWRWLFALLLPPAAPYLALKNGLVKRSVAWIVLACAYAVALVLAR